jgi:AraC family transcriptional regulator of adaptative response/methylated-DNA-[protein]-cysteine methyltransferase
MEPMLLLAETHSNSIVTSMVSAQVPDLATAQSVVDDASKLRGVMERDELLDGVFVFAVRSTRIYCNPSCPSRRPSKNLIEFYDSPSDAEQHGFRPCKRCRPRENRTPRRSELAKKVCDYVDANLTKSLTLRTIGSQFEISAFHLHRIFKRVTGMTLHDYVQARRLAVLKRELQRGEPVTRAAYHAGFSSRSRLYNRIQDKLGMQPGTYRRGGKGIAIIYTIIDSPFGRLLIAATREGICSVCLGESDAFVETALVNEYPAASIQRDDDALRDLASQFSEYVRNRRFGRVLPLDLHGTPFQMKVWEQLQTIPPGSTRSYEQIANELGSPNAVRAVARTCASNPAILLVPCHRVVRKNGELGGYRWGLERKRALLRHERTNTQI